VSFGNPRTPPAKSASNAPEKTCGNAPTTATAGTEWSGSDSRPSGGVAQGVKANVLFFDARPAQEKPWTKTLSVYELRTNRHFTLKEASLKRSDLDDFVECYHPANRHRRKPTWGESNPDGRWRAFECDDCSSATR
jgi:hypothetical protein